jgi:V-type H+-transporting ATPase proteolipid subunit
MGVTFALVFANLGAAYGTMKSGVGIASIGILKPEIIMKSIIPVVKIKFKVMAGILGIYGMIVSVILTTKSINFLKVKRDDYGYY